MSTLSSAQRAAVDYGVQIRFISGLDDSTGGQPTPPQPRPKSRTTSRYGVAVRVQGIDGQPYVVLKDGEKGDSYGVQLRSHYPPGYSSLPRGKERVEPGSRGADAGGALRRAQSHGSLLDRGAEAGGEDYHMSRPPGDGKSGSYGSLDGGVGARGERGHAQRAGVTEGETDGSGGSARDTRSSHTPPQQTHELLSQRQATGVNRPISRSPQRTPVPYTSPPPATAPGHGAEPRSSPAETRVRRLLLVSTVITASHCESRSLICVSR